MNAVVLGFAVARVAYRDHTVIDQLRAQLAARDAEIGRLRGENWRLRDENTMRWNTAIDQARTDGRTEGRQQAAELFAVTTAALQEQVAGHAAELAAYAAIHPVKAGHR